MSLSASGAGSQLFFYSFGLQDTCMSQCASLYCTSPRVKTRTGFLLLKQSTTNSLVLLIVTVRGFLLHHVMKFSDVSSTLRKLYLNEHVSHDHTCQYACLSQKLQYLIHSRHIKGKLNINFILIIMVHILNSDYFTLQVINK